ncbi:hypothetical protein [Nonomuraea sp. NPDC003709]|uniref:hypothetical protein n=1 Tax=Nonomuraea sp. NPDC003709 TaxID=3154450 RepID=UPI0033B8555E
MSVKIVSLAENFNLNTKDGRFVFAVLPRPAEYELELRAERQAEGIATADGAKPRARCGTKPVNGRTTRKPRLGRRFHASPGEPCFASWSDYRSCPAAGRTQGVAGQLAA